MMRPAETTTTPGIRPGLTGFEAFCEVVGLDLEPFQRKIARAMFGAEREALVLLPRGNGKTTLLAAIAAHHLLTHEHPMVYLGAASVAQARIAFEAARDFCSHPAVADLVTVRALELRRSDGTTGVMRMVPSDGPKAHGLQGSLYLCDELWAHRDGALYEAMRSALVKRPDARMCTISTADVGPERPLSRLRARALAAPTVKRTGGLTTCTGAGLTGLLWEVDDETDIDDLTAAKAVNPASWITLTALREQRAALPDGAYARFHLNSRVAPEGAWLPVGAWQACVGRPSFEDGEPVWIGVDVGGEASHTAVVWINAALHVGVETWIGEEGILHAIDAVRDFASQYSVQEVIADPWRFGQAGLELAREGLRVAHFPQTDVRMVPASGRLREAIIQQRLTLPDDPTLSLHASNAIQRHGRRGWRLDKPDRSSPIDALVALCMALERAEHHPEPMSFLGWL